MKMFFVKGTNLTKILMRREEVGFWVYCDRPMDKGCKLHIKIYI
jgi:hypothetical protein